MPVPGETGIHDDSGDDGLVDETSAGGDESAGSESGDDGPSGGMLEPEVECAPAGDVCASLSPDTGLYASYRKDYYFTNDIYDEDTEPPVDGGRIQIAAIAAVSGPVTGVRIDGVDPEIIYTENPQQMPPFEWYHVWPREAVAGEPIWVAFHSRETKWDAAAQAELRVLTDGGDAVNGAFAVQRSDVLLTYVTTSDSLDAVIVHAKNTGSQTRTLERLLVGGRDVLAGDIACVAESGLAPGQSAMWTVPLCDALSLGQAWTVTAEFDDGSFAVGTGRVMKPRFPIEAWNNTSECPWPSGNAENHASLRGAGVDTLYTHGGVCAPDNCDCDTLQVVGVELPENDLSTLVTFDLVAEGFPTFPSTEGIAAVSTGDESDGSIQGDNGVPVPADKAHDSRRSWARYPELPTFNGGKTNKHIGAFAGMTDIQGMDLYIAACAPHITVFGQHPPVRGAYDYLLNTRNNHMPLPTWLYAQGLSPAWNENEVSIQPDRQEILVQALSVVAAGGKGFMWFQVNQEEAEHAPERWEAIIDANTMVEAVRTRLRTGDLAGLARSSDPVLVASIRSGDAIVIPVISLSTTAGPDDLACLLTLSEDAVPHWIFADTTAAVSVDVPRDMALADVFEVTPAGVVDVSEGYTLQGRTVRFDGLSLDNDMPVRLLVLATNGDVRDDMQAQIGR